MIKIVYACNDAMFEPIYLTTLSIVRRTKEPVHFYMLTADLQEMNAKYVCFNKKHTNILNKMVQKYNKQNVFETIDCTKIYKKYYGKFELRKNYIAPYVLVRTLVFDVKQLTGKILYLDADIMANKDIGLLYNLDLGDHELMACRDYFLKTRYFKRYFNAGVMLINLDKVRKTKLFQKVSAYVQEHKPMYCEQDAINKCQTSAIEFPKNPYRFNYQWAKIKEDTILKHFVGGMRLNPKHFKIRQWDIKKVQDVLKIHNWDEDYKIFLKAKKEWSK